jgi:hypothetical protein
MAGMGPAGRMLVHQVHLAKVATDVTASVVSDVLRWKAPSGHRRLDRGASAGG